MGKIDEAKAVDAGPAAYGIAMRIGPIEALEYLNSVPYSMGAGDGSRWDERMGRETGGQTENITRWVIEYLLVGLHVL